MEPVNCTVHLRPDACDIWVGIQVAARARDIAAATAGLPVEKVTIHNHLSGPSAAASGGFHPSRPHRPAVDGPWGRSGPARPIFATTDTGPITMTVLLPV
jgi:hypothetical protein